MTVEEDLALIELKDRLLAEASQSDAAPYLKLRLKIIENLSLIESESERERKQRRMGSRGLLDRVETLRDTDDYWRDLHASTEPDRIWRQQEATYNVLETRTRPPPPSQAELRY